MHLSGSFATSDGASVVDALRLQASEKDGVLTGVGESKYGPYSVVGSRAANGLKLRKYRLVGAPACAPSLFDGSAIVASRACTTARHHGMPAATSCRLGQPPVKKRGSAALAVAQISVSTWAPVSPAVTGVAPVPDGRASVHSPGALPLAKPQQRQCGCVYRSVNAAEARRCGLAAHCVASYACATPARGCDAASPRSDQSSGVRGEAPAAIGTARGSSTATVAMRALPNAREASGKPRECKARRRAALDRVEVENDWPSTALGWSTADRNPEDSL